MYLLDRLDVVPSKPRTGSSLGLFGDYDGNLIGGLMIGLGMTLTGACPGTVLVQVAAGVSSGRYVLLGGILAGIIYSRYSGLLRRPQAASSTPASREHLTVQGKLGINPRTAVLAYEIMCAICIYLAAILGPKDGSRALNPIVGGALIGAAQTATLILTGNPVGVSGAYGVLGDYFWNLLSSGKPRPRPNALYFATGLLLGSTLFFRSLPVAAAESSAISVSPIRAVLGGFVMVLGARIAGGCTSGHGISGMSMLSVSSFVSVAAMFAGGMLSALVL